MNTSAEMCAYLHQLAYQVEQAYWPEARQKLATRLHELADHQLVQLPTVDPRHANLQHWIELDNATLRQENDADGWNLACGLTVARDRAAMTEASRDAS